MSSLITNEPNRLFNFTIPLKTFQILEKLSKHYNCSVAHIVRQGIDLLLEKQCATKRK